MIEKYRDIVGDKVIDKLQEKVKDFACAKMVHVNSTYYGGGVSELLNSLVILLNKLGIKTTWHLLKGTNSFFNITKRFHNALQGADIKLTDYMKNTYKKVIKNNSIFMHLEDFDFVFIHDPQPVALINYYKNNKNKTNSYNKSKEKQKWIWRCHLCLLSPKKSVWNFIKRYVNMYDISIFSSKQFMQKLNIPQKIIMPSIDPLTEKNKYMKPETVEKILSLYAIDLNKPIISQVSRFDPWKDPLGVIDSFKIIKKKVNCQLVMMANIAIDDPESSSMHKKILEKIKKEKIKDIHLLVNVHDNDRTVNALQRASSVVLQKSIKEGFGLTVTEALWKGTPVVGGNVGGIRLQIIDGKTGFLVNNVKECAEKTIYLLKHKKKARQMGNLGKEYVRKNFLTPRELLDYLDLMDFLKKCKKIKKKTEETEKCKRKKLRSGGQLEKLLARQENMQEK